ncbi:hypothetical protein JKY72_01490 [Candidatus Gracilibacteria bacterium]|nr:hypothetical protein [Candidatus Gracilibacteria bacterium]
MIKIRIVSILVLVCFVAVGCTGKNIIKERDERGFYVEPEILEQKFFDEFETENLDIAVCLELPLQEVYFDGVREYQHFPMMYCLTTLYLDSFDIEVCEVLGSVDYIEYRAERFDCYRFIAEFKSDISICDNLESDATCRALATLDASYCYEMKKDDYDKSLYARGVGRCIGDVVLRTEDYETCLQIDGPDFGEQWVAHKNACLDTAVYFREKRGESFMPLCELMEDDFDSPVSKKDYCFSGKATDYSR